MGICAHCLLFGTLPFEGSDPLDLFENIRTTKLALPIDEHTGYTMRFATRSYLIVLMPFAICIHM